jgi:hypothetical protein
MPQKSFFVKPHQFLSSLSVAPPRSASNPSSSPGDWLDELPLMPEQAS